jgi:single-strand DNA-binding protein
VLFLAHGFGAIPAPGSFNDSALFGSSQKISEILPRFFAPLRKSVASLWEQRPLAFSVPRVTGAEKEIFEMYLNSVQIIGFIGKDPERRHARSNGAAFTVLSVATQRSWRNADDEWASKTEWHRVVAWNSLGERVAASLHQGDHILVEGTLVSSTFDREYGKGKKATIVKHTVWQIRADSIRKLNRAEKEPEALASGSDAAEQPSALSQTGDAPF